MDSRPTSIEWFTYESAESNGSPAKLGSFGESFRGFSKEAKTHGFPPPSFSEFGFVVIGCRFFILLVAGKILIVNIIEVVPKKRTTV